jgi:hypothetical protein
VVAPRPTGDGFAFGFAGDEKERAALLARMVAAGLEPVRFTAREADLEALFLEFTEGEVQ